MSEGLQDTAIPARAGPTTNCVKGSMPVLCCPLPPHRQCTMQDAPSYCHMVPAHGGVPEYRPCRGRHPNRPCQPQSQVLQVIAALHAPQTHKNLTLVSWRVQLSR
jgi:hypothetical protein